MASLAVSHTLLVLHAYDGGTAERGDLIQQDGDPPLPILLHALKGLRHRLRGTAEVVDLPVALREKRLESSNVGGNLFWWGLDQSLIHGWHHSKFADGKEKYTNGINEKS